MFRLRTIKMPTLTLFIIGLALVYTSVAQTTRTITDMSGRKVVIPLKVTKVYVDKHCTMLVYAFDSNIAVNTVYELPENAKKYLRKEYLDKPYSEGSDEEIIRLHPDIILMCDEVSPQVVDQANRLQTKIKIPVVVVEMSMWKSKETIVFLGGVLSKPQQVQELTDFVKTYIEPIGTKAKTIVNQAKVQVYYATATNGLSTDPAGTRHTQILDFIGAENVAKIDKIPGKGMSQASMEQILMWHPQVVLVWTGSGDNLTTYKHILSDPLWSNIAAVKNKRVYQIPWLPFGWFDRPPGSNRLLGTVWTANLLYPKLYAFDMVAVTQEYFKKFYHYDLSRVEAIKLINPKP
jgi:iron complex transport system substrate-binding protein